MRAEERDREAAFYRNVAGWSSLGLGILAFFWTLSNSFQTMGVRIAAVIVGCLSTMAFAFLAVIVHQRPLGGYSLVMILAVILANLIPAIFLLATVFPTGEYRFAQNKQ